MSLEISTDNSFTDEMFLEINFHIHFSVAAEMSLEILKGNFLSQLKCRWKFQQTIFFHSWNVFEISTDNFLSQLKCRWKLPRTIFYHSWNVVGNFNRQFFLTAKMSLEISTDKFLWQLKCLKISTDNFLSQLKYRWKFPRTIFSHS